MKNKEIAPFKIESLKKFNNLNTKNESKKIFKMLELTKNELDMSII